MVNDGLTVSSSGYGGVLEKLMGFDADAAELEDGGDGEPDDDAEEDWRPVVLLDVTRPKVIRPRRSLALVPGAVG
jgi:hypothetical protein